MTNEQAAGVPWHDLSREELDFQLSPSKSAKDALGTLDRHIRETSALASSPAVNAYLQVPYGDGPSQRFDVYRSAKTDRSEICVAFVHGGFWQEGSTAGAGFAGAEVVARGGAIVPIGYTLTPRARLRDIVEEIAQAVVTLGDRLGTFGIDPSKLVLAGHSAGAHLVAAIVAGLDSVDAARSLAGAVLISGVYDLNPIAASYVNDLAGIDDTEIADLSPLFKQPAYDVPVKLLIGADEPQAFQLQTNALFHAWKPALSDLTRESVPGRDHFDILDELADRVLRA